MTTVPFFDLGDPKVRANPYPFYRALQLDQPLARTPTGAWMVCRYHDVQSILRDHRFSTDPAKLGRRARKGRRPDRGSLVRQSTTTTLLLFQDPPDHTRIRSLVNKAFTPRRVEALEPQTRAIVDELLDGIEARTRRFDVLADFGFLVPVGVICELLGVPRADQDRFREWSAATTRLLDGNLSQAEQVEGMVASAHLIQYFNRLYGERRAAPRDDLLTALVEAEEQGDRLSEAELRLITVLLFVAGHETTLNLIGNGTLALLRNPDQLELLRAEPSLVRGAVDELLRYDSPVHLTVRIATEAVEMHGRLIPPGDTVICALGAANRDPEVFAEPDRLDVCRPNAGQHLAFSQGIHHCIGAALARSEAEAAFSALIARFPDLGLVTTEPEYREHQVVRGLKELVVRI